MAGFFYITNNEYECIFRTNLIRVNKYISSKNDSLKFKEKMNEETDDVDGLIERLKAGKPPSLVELGIIKRAIYNVFNVHHIKVGTKYHYYLGGKPYNI